jgi:hypothetical protein
VQAEAALLAELAADNAASPRSRRGLARHLASVRRKLDHRRLLDIKREAGIRRAIADLLPRPRALVGVGVDVLRDKIGAPPARRPAQRLLFDAAEFAAG